MLTLKLISEETERVIKGLGKKHFKGAKEAIEMCSKQTDAVVKHKQNQTRTSKKPNLWLPKWEH